MSQNMEPTRVSRLGAMLSKVTPSLTLACFVTALLNLLFGFDTTSFAGVQSIPAFERQFGTPTGPDGEYELSGARASFVSSIGFLGKFCGTLSAPFLIEHIGHRFTMFFLCMVSFAGVTIECTSHLVAQFVLGRIIVYYSVGLAENCSTYSYANAILFDIVPASMRGAVVGSIQLFIQFGQIMASGINRVYSTETVPKGWIIPVAMQVCVPVGVVIGTFFIPNAPRWLIRKGRRGDAVRSLEKVRPSMDVAAGHCQIEADAIQDSINNETEKGAWMDLFRGTNLRRTGIATVVFILQQFTGQAFVSQYSPRFYISLGLGEHAFDYNIASAVVGWAGVVIGMFLIDTTGRRSLLIWGAALQALFLFAMAGLGNKSNPSKADADGLVASVMLFNLSFSGTWAPISYVIASEIGTGPLREKTMSFTSSINVIAAWLVAFVVPYLLDLIGPNIGWLFGGFSIFATVYAYLFVPEIMNRSLEELDQLFDNDVPARKFASTETFGAGRIIADLENNTGGVYRPVDRPSQDSEDQGKASTEAFERMSMERLLGERLDLQRETDQIDNTGNG